MIFAIGDGSTCKFTQYKDERKKKLLPSSILLGKPVMLASAVYFLSCNQLEISINPYVLKHIN